MSPSDKVLPCLPEVGNQRLEPPHARRLKVAAVGDVVDVSGVSDLCVSTPPHPSPIKLLSCTSSIQHTRLPLAPSSLLPPPSLPPPSSSHALPLSRHPNSPIHITIPPSTRPLNPALRIKPIRIKPLMRGRPSPIKIPILMRQKRRNLPRREGRRRKVHTLTRKRARRRMVLWARWADFASLLG